MSEETHLMFSPSLNHLMAEIGVPDTRQEISRGLSEVT